MVKWKEMWASITGWIWKSVAQFTVVNVCTFPLSGCSQWEAGVWCKWTSLGERHRMCDLWHTERFTEPHPQIRDLWNGRCQQKRYLNNQNIKGYLTNLFCYSSFRIVLEFGPAPCTFLIVLTAEGGIGRSVHSSSQLGPLCVGLWLGVTRSGWPHNAH